MDQRLGGVGDERRTKPDDAVTVAHGDDVTDLVHGQFGRVEAVAVAAVDLQIEEGGRDPAGFEVGGFLSRRTHVGYPLGVHADIDQLGGGVILGTDAHKSGGKDWDGWLCSSLRL